MATEARAICVETERGRRRGEESYSCTATTPDDGSAKVSAQSARLLGALDGDDAFDLLQGLHHALQLLQVRAHEREDVHRAPVVAGAAVGLADVDALRAEASGRRSPGCRAGSRSSTRSCTRAVDLGLASPR